MRLLFVGNGYSIHLQRWMAHFTKENDVHLAYAEKTDFILPEYLHLPELKGKVTFHPFPSQEYNGKIKRLLYGGIDKITNKRLYDHITTSWLRRLVKQLKPDIIDCHYLGYWAWIAAKIDHHPLIATAWGSDVIEVDTMGDCYRLQFILREADAVLVNSQVLGESAIAQGAEPEKIKHINWGVDLNKFNPDIDSLAYRKLLKIQNDSPVVISIRNFEPIYSIDTLIKAIPPTLKEVPNAIFIIKGEGTLTNELKKLASQLNVAKSARFLGEAEYDDVPLILKSGDVYVSTAITDSLPSSLMEAMACGMPVVVGDVPSLFEWVKNGENGYLFERRNSEDLAEKIVRLFNNPEERAAMGRKNRRMMEDVANQETCMKEIDEIYRQLVVR